MSFPRLFFFFFHRERARDSDPRISLSNVTATLRKSVAKQPPATSIHPATPGQRDVVVTYRLRRSAGRVPARKRRNYGYLL